MTVQLKSSNGINAILQNLAQSNCGCALCATTSLKEKKSTGNAGKALADSTQPNSVNALLGESENRWGNNGTVVKGKSTGAVTINYSFMASVPSYYNAKDDTSNFLSFNTTQRALTRFALRLYSDIANITFKEVSDAGKGGTLRFGFASPSSPSTRGWAWLPQTHEKGGDVWINRSFANDISVGSWTFGTLLHEIGHALGLKHPFDSTPKLLDWEDNYKYTNMSYKQHPNTANVRPRTPQLYDVAAIQYLYGKNWSTRSGNDTYSWGTNESFIQTIWDGNGRDKIDASNQIRPAVINLAPGTFSSIGAQQNDSGDAYENVAIPSDVVIEDATGGSGSDWLFGNGADNFLAGMAERDYLYGMNGNDILAGGGSGNYLNGGNGNDFAVGGEGIDTILGEQGSDTLYGATGNDDMDGGWDNDNLYGNDGHDTLKGNYGSDYLVGGSDGSTLTNTGDDFLDGGFGSDILKGQDGNDTYVVDSSLDQVIEVAYEGNDTVRSSISYTLGNHTENLTLTESAYSGAGNSLNNMITGNDSNNELVGHGGTDTLTGGNGIDRLNGYGTIVTNESQFDLLIGGSGADYFVLGGTWGVSYIETGDGYAIVQDWDAAADWFQARGNAGQYSLEFKNVLGSSTVDTEIYYLSGGAKDRIGIVQDTTNVSIYRDFSFV